MKTEPPPHYQRLPGTGRRLMTICSLWLAVDHLLSVTNISYVQEYKRFYFSDIQALIVRPTHTGKAWNAFWGSLTLVFAAISLQAPVEILALPLIPGVVCLVGLLVNLAKGPTCVSHICTAVQTETLPSLGRLRNASRVTVQIRPLIVAAQNSLAVGSAAQPTAAPLDAAPEQPLPPIVDGAHLPPQATGAGLATEPDSPP